MASSTSSIHYKFGNDVELKTLSFDGIHISHEELKKSISQIEGISLEYNDLSLTNADTKRVYEGSCFIPRNSTVILKRIPRVTPIRMPKVNGNETSGAVSSSTKPVDEVPVIGHINQEDFAKMSEDERLKHIKLISTHKYNPINFNKKVQAYPNGIVPPDFRCNRCNVLGHHPKQCQMQTIRKTTGIPSEELMDALPTDPNALLHQSGRYVIPILHYKARETRKLVDRALFEREQQLANNKDVNHSTVDEKRYIPQELKCPLCHEILSDALLAPCCGESFCAECIQNYMLQTSENEEGARCPTCTVSKPLSIDSLIPNKRIRDAVQRHKATTTTFTTTKSTVGSIPLAAVQVAAHDVTSTTTTMFPVTATNGISKSQSPPSNEIIRLPTVDLTKTISPVHIKPVENDSTKYSQPIYKANTPSPVLNTSSSNSPALNNEVECPPGTLPPPLPPTTTAPSSLHFNPNIPPPNFPLRLPTVNLTNVINRPMTNHPLNFNQQPLMGGYSNPIGTMVSGNSMNFNCPPPSAMVWQPSNDGPPGVTPSVSRISIPPGTEIFPSNIATAYRIPRIEKRDRRRDSDCSDDKRRRQRRYEKNDRERKERNFRDMRIRKRSISPLRDRSSYRDSYRARNERDQRKRRRSHDQDDEKSSSKRHKKDEREESKSSKRHQKDKKSGESTKKDRERDESSKSKKKSSKKEKKSKKDN